MQSRSRSVTKERRDKSLADTSRDRSRSRDRSPTKTPVTITFTGSSGGTGVIKAHMLLSGFDSQQNELRTGLIDGFVEMNETVIIPGNQFVKLGASVYTPFRVLLFNKTVYPLLFNAINTEHSYTILKNHLLYKLNDNIRSKIFFNNNDIGMILVLNTEFMKMNNPPTQQQLLDYYNNSLVSFTGGNKRYKNRKTHKRRKTNKKKIKI